MTWDNETGHEYGDEDIADNNSFDESFDALLGQSVDDYNPEDAGMDNSPLPDDKYQVKIDTIEITQSKKGKRMLKWQFKVLNGKYAGRCHWKYNMMTTPENATFLTRDLKTCGVNARTVATLQNALNGMLNMELEIKVKTKGEFQNTYINKKLDGSTVDRPDTVNRQGDADYENDAPF